MLALACKVATKSISDRKRGGGQQEEEETEWMMRPMEGVEGQVVKNVEFFATVRKVGSRAKGQNGFPRSEECVELQVDENVWGNFSVGESKSLGAKCQEGGFRSKEGVERRWARRKWESFLRTIELRSEGKCVSANVTFVRSFFLSPLRKMECVEGQVEQNAWGAGESTESARRCGAANRGRGAFSVNKSTSFAQLGIVTRSKRSGNGGETCETQRTTISAG